MKLKKVVVKALRRSAALRHNLRQRSKDLLFRRVRPESAGNQRARRAIAGPRGGGDVARRKYAAA